MFEKYVFCVVCNQCVEPNGIYNHYTIANLALHMAVGDLSFVLNRTIRLESCLILRFHFLITTIFTQVLLM